MTDLPLCPIIQAPRIIGYEECTISDESCAGKHERMIIWFDTFTFPQNSIPFLLCNFNFLNSIWYAFWYNGEGKSHELWNYRWEDGMGRDMFCVPPCFVSTGNKCILLCAFSPIAAKLNENNEELRMEHSGVYSFIVHSCLFKICNQSRDRLGRVGGRGGGGEKQ